MLYVVLATFAAGMATEYFLGNRWIGFFAVGVPACLYFFSLDYQKRAAAKKEERAREGHCHRPVQRRGGLPAVCRRCGDRAYRFQ